MKEYPTSAQRKLVPGLPLFIHLLDVLLLCLRPHEYVRSITHFLEWYQLWYSKRILRISKTLLLRNRLYKFISILNTTIPRCSTVRNFLATTQIYDHKLNYISNQNLLKENHHSVYDEDNGAVGEVTVAAHVVLNSVYHAFVPPFVRESERYELEVAYLPTLMSA